MGAPFRTINTSSDELNRIQANIAALANSISGPLLGGQLISNVSLKSGNPNPINHGLGRVPVLWVLCDQNTNTSVWRTDWSTVSITLNCGTDCIVSLYVN